jgi:hypothetical protein
MENRPFAGMMLSAPRFAINNQTTINQQFPTRELQTDI